MDYKVTLVEVLDEREQRSHRQQELIKKYNCPLVSFTLNIPGETKDFPLARAGFVEGYHKLLEELETKNLSIVFEEFTHKKTGSVGYIVVETHGKTLKIIAKNIELFHPLGRLFDMDVVDLDFEQISGKDLNYPPRTCLVCGKEAFGCARSRTHSLEELSQSVLDILRRNPSLSTTFSHVSKEFLRSILYEASASPKPGLVDRFNNGSHDDMDFFTFLDSSLALSDYFTEITTLGFQYIGQSPIELFSILRNPGMIAEKAMFDATGGINTHKGIVFSLGLIGAAYGRLLATGNHITSQSLANYCAKMTAQVIEHDFDNVTLSTATTNGETLFAKHGILGIRGEAQDGFPTVINFGLPAFQYAMEQQFHINDAMLYTLLHIMKNLNDTNILWRQDFETLEYVKSKAKEILDLHGENMIEIKKEMVHLDEIFIENNISPGGGADLLAVTMALYFLEHNSHKIVG